MSININGNKITKFGEILPTPYFDKIEIEDERIKVFYSYYFQKPQEVDEDTFHTYVDTTLDQLHTMAIIMPKYALNTATDSYAEAMVPYVEPFIINNHFDPKQAILDSSEKIYDLVRLTHALQANGVYSTSINGSTYVFDDVRGSALRGFNGLSRHRGAYYKSSSPETIYDANGSEVKRYSYQLNIDIDNESAADTYSIIQAVNNIASLELCLFLASTSLDISSNEARETLFLSPESEYFKTLYGQQISDINYEVIANNGTFRSKPERIYRYTTTGVPYSDGPVLQTIDRLYYAVDNAVRTDIMNNMRTAVQSGWKLPSGGTVSVNLAITNGELKDEQFNDARKNILYVLEVFGNTPSLLPKLADALNIFPNTDTATRVGRMHERLEIAVFNANNAVKNSGIEVIKQINLNTYVKDLRTSPTYVLSGRYTDAAYTNRIRVNTLDEYIYHNAFRYGSYLDPNGFTEALRNSPSGICNYHGSTHDTDNYPASEGTAALSSQTIMDILDDKTTKQLKEGKDDLFRWFNETMHINKEGSNKPPDSDYGKIIQFLGDSSRLPEAQKVIARMILIGADELTSGAAVALHSYVGGLSEASRPNDTIETMKEGWHFKSYTTEYAVNWSNNPTNDGGFNSLKQDLYQVLIRILHQLNFTNTLGVDLHFFAATAIEVQTNAILFCILNKYCEAIESDMTSFNAYLSGFWWFDYEKALKERSLISFVWSASKLENFFDKNLLNNHFKVDETNIDRYYYKREWTAVTRP